MVGAKPDVRPRLERGKAWGDNVKENLSTSGVSLKTASLYSGEIHRLAYRRAISLRYRRHRGGVDY